MSDLISSRFNINVQSVDMTTYWAAPEVLNGEHPTAAAGGNNRDIVDSFGLF